MVTVKEKDNLGIFTDLIKKHKKDHFKTLTTIHHEFLYSCLHPQDDDLVLCLERNVYPNNLEMYDLKEMIELHDGTEIPKLEEEDEEANEKGNKSPLTKKADQEMGVFGSKVKGLL